MSRITLLEMLLRAGLINETQFDEALQNRVLHGGKIGTSLIELGFVGEEDLARFLSRKLSVPYASPEHLKNIQPETIAVIPQALALKYHAIPLKCDKKKLALAMVDPADLKAVDEISFATGYIIRPVVAPEVRLMQALAHYYGAEVPPRYLQIARQLEKERGKATPEAVPPAPVGSGAEAVLAASADPQMQPPEPETARNDLSPVDSASIPRQEAAAEQSTGEPEAALGPEGGEAAAESGSEIAGKETDDDLLVAEIVDEEWIDQVEKFSIDEISQKLSWAGDREEIAQALMNYLGPRFTRSAIFTLRAGAAYGWKGAYGEKEIPHFHQFRLPLDSPSVLKTVAEGGEGHFGPVPATVSNALLQEALGGNVGAEALVLPIAVTGTTVGIVYGEKGEGDLAEERRELKKILFKAGLAFEILICREKIQMMTGAENAEESTAAKGGGR